jgi:hypothetical protein
MSASAATRQTEGARRDIALCGLLIKYIKIMGIVNRLDPSAANRTAARHAR